MGEVEEEEGEGEGEVVDAGERVDEGAILQWEGKRGKRICLTLKADGKANDDKRYKESYLLVAIACRTATLPVHVVTESHIGSASVLLLACTT